MLKTRSCPTKIKPKARMILPLLFSIILEVIASGKKN